MDGNKFINITHKNRLDYNLCHKAISKGCNLRYIDDLMLDRFPELSIQACNLDINSIQSVSERMIAKSPYLYLQLCRFVHILCNNLFGEISKILHGLTNFFHSYDFTKSLIILDRQIQILFSYAPNKVIKIRLIYIFLGILKLHYNFTKIELIKKEIPASENYVRWTKNVEAIYKLNIDLLLNKNNANSIVLNNIPIMLNIEDYLQKYKNNNKNKWGVFGFLSNIEPSNDNKNTQIYWSNTIYYLKQIEKDLSME